jgi:hypothetical protein
MRRYAAFDWRVNLGGLRQSAAALAFQSTADSLGYLRAQGVPSDRGVGRRQGNLDRSVAAAQSDLPNEPASMVTVAYKNRSSDPISAICTRPPHSQIIQFFRQPTSGHIVSALKRNSGLGRLKRQLAATPASLR